MKTHSSPRESGSTLLILLLALLLLLAGLASMLTVTSLSSMRAVVESEDSMRAYFVADSGVQGALARVRASNGGLDPVSYTESLAQGTAAVDIQKPTSTLYRIHSTGTFEDLSQQVELYLRYEGGFSLPGLLTINFSRGTMVSGTGVRVQSQGLSVMSGMDHAPDGSLLADQSAAKYALAMNAIPGQTDFGIDYGNSGGSTINGYPDISTNDAEPQDIQLLALRDQAVNNADIAIVGSKALSDGDVGHYGTQIAPKLVYARLKDGQTLSMNNYFTGWGTLVLDVENATKSTVFKMTGEAKWQGIVLLYFRNNAELVNNSLIDMTGGSKVIGGMAVFFNNNRTSLSGKGTIFRIAGNAQILYSYELIRNAPGTETLAERNAVMTAYRTL